MFSKYRVSHAQYLLNFVELVFLVDIEFCKIDFVLNTKFPNHKFFQRTSCYQFFVKPSFQNSINADVALTG